MVDDSSKEDDEVEKPRDNRMSTPEINSEREMSQISSDLKEEIDMTNKRLLPRDDDHNENDLNQILNGSVDESAVTKIKGTSFSFDESSPRKRSHSSTNLMVACLRS